MVVEQNGRRQTEDIGEEYVREDDSAIPLAIKRLYPNGKIGPRDLSMVTETPPHMILPLVRMRMVAESLKDDREQSLLEIFVEEFDSRMISRARKGREEFIDIMGQEKEQDIEDIVI